MPTIAERYAALKAARASAGQAPAYGWAEELWGLPFLERAAKGASTFLAPVGKVADVAGRALSVTRYLNDLGARETAQLLGLGSPDQTIGRDELGLPVKGNAVEMGMSAILPDRKPTEEPSGLADLTGLDEGTLETILPAMGPLGAVAGVLDMDRQIWKARQAAEKLGGPRAAAAVDWGREALKRPLSVGLGMATDPATAAGGVAATRALGAKSATALGRAAGVDRALAGLGALVGGAQGTEALAKGVSHAAKGKPGEASLDALDAILGLGMAGLGAAGYRHSKDLQRAARTAAKGKIYVHDPAAPAELRAARAAELAEEARQAKAAEDAAVAAREAEAQAQAAEAERAGNEAARARLEAFDAQRAGLTVAAVEGAARRPGVDPLSRAALAEGAPDLSSEAGGPLLEPAEPGGPGLVPETGAPDLGERARALEAQRASAAEYEARRAAEDLAPEGPAEPAWAEAAGPAIREEAPGVTPEKQFASDVRRGVSGAFRNPLEALLLPEEQAASLAQVGPEVRLSPAAQRAAGEVGAAGAPIPGGRQAAAVAPYTDALEALYGGFLPPEPKPVKAPKPPKAAKPAGRQVAPLEPEAPEAIAEREVGASQRKAERASLKSAGEGLENIPGPGVELAGRARAYTWERDVMPQAWQARVMRAIEDAAPNDSKGGAKLFESLVPAIEGQVPLESLPPEHRNIVAAARAALDDVRDQFTQAYRAEYGGDPPAKMLEDYFPHTAKDRSPFEELQQARLKAREENIPAEEALRQIREPRALGIQTRGSRSTSYEKARTADPIEYRKDVGVLMDYFSAMGDRIAELKHLGRDGSKAQALIDLIPGESRGTGDRAFAQTFFDRLRNAQPRGGWEPVEQALHLARTGGAVSGLTMSWTLQPLQMLQTVRVLGPRAVAVAVKDLATKGLERGDMAHPLRVAKQLRQNLRQARLDAHEIGAGHARLNYDMAEAWAMADAAQPVEGGAAAAGSLGGRAAKKAGRVYWLRATSWLDNSARAATLRAWEAVGPKMIERAKAGDAREARALDFMGVDWKGYDGSPEAQARAAKQSVDALQYRPHATNLPGWAGSPLGRVAFQFTSFAHQHARFVNYLVQNAAKDPGRTASYLAIGLPFAMGTNWFRDALKGKGINPEDVDSENFSRALTESLAGKRRVSTFAGGHEALINVARGVLSLGVGAHLQAALERVGGESIGDMGPALRAVDTMNGVAGGLKDVGAAAAGAATQAVAGDAGHQRAALAELERSKDTLAKSATRGVAQVLPQVPIPFVMSGPSELVAELQSTKKRTNPGWAGLTRDLLEERGAITPIDPSAVGREGRKRQAQLEEDTRAAQDARKRAELGLEPKPQRTLGDDPRQANPKLARGRATMAERSRMRAVLKERLVVAQEQGDVDALVAVLTEAAENGLGPNDIGWKDVMRRVIPMPPSQDEEFEEAYP